MADLNLQFIDLGTTPNDGTGDDLRTAGGKINANSAQITTQVNDLSDRTDALEENQITGVLVYPLYSDLPQPGEANISYKVVADTDPTLNGYYYWDGSAYQEETSTGDDGGVSDDTLLFDGQPSSYYAKQADLNTVDTQTASNTTNIGNNTTNIGNNATNISTNSTGVAQNATDILQNSNDIITNVNNINANLQSINNNDTDIADHETRITQNEGDISTLQTDSSTLRDDVDSNDVDIQANADNITANADNITTNTAGVGANTASIVTLETETDNHIADSAIHVSPEDRTLWDSGGQNIGEVLVDENSSLQYLETAIAEGDNMIITKDTETDQLVLESTQHQEYNELEFIAQDTPAQVTSDTFKMYCKVQDNVSYLMAIDENLNEIIISSSK